MKMTENNRMLKLIALALAIVLWLYVGTQQDPLAQHTYEVQLEMENLPVDKTASLSEETVKVRVMGRQDRLNALSGSDFKATVDLSNVEEGEHTLPVQVTLPNEVYFARTNPSMVNVQVDALQGSEMSVDINTTGTLPDGVTLEDMSVEPQKVFVTSDDAVLLAEVDSVGVSVDLASIYDDSKQNVDVQFYDIAGNPINDERLQALPAQVSLSIKTSQSDTEKTVPIQANLVGQLPQGVQIESVSIQPETATVSGAPEDLAAIESVRTAAIDLSQISQTTTLSVALESDAVTTPESVSVTLSVTTAADDDNASGVRMLPVALSGAAASSVYADVQMVEVTYHMQPGYQDAGDALTAYVLVEQTPTGATTAQVQLSSVEGLVVDAISPDTVTLYPTTTTDPATDPTDHTTTTY